MHNIDYGRLSCPVCEAPGEMTPLSDRAQSGNIRWRCGACKHRTTLPAGMQRAVKQLGELVLADVLPDPDEEVNELLERRKKQFARKKAYEEARKLINVKIPIDGPIAIHHFGDPHVDDDGTDIELLQKHMQLINETEGLYAANVGDTTNNWIGRLARLYGEQGTTTTDAWKLAEWFIRQTRKWIYIIGGNHDCWSGSGDPLIWMTRQIGALYESSEARLGLKFRGVKDPITINARHDFKGHSQWNPAHGVAKAAQMGIKDDILICGHKHVSGYNIVKCPATGKLSHCVQVGSYKTYDRYAREAGFRDQMISPAVITVIDPYSDTETGKVTVFHDIDKGIAFLKQLRSEYFSRKQAA